MYFSKQEYTEYQLISRNFTVCQGCMSGSHEELNNENVGNVHNSSGAHNGL